MAKRKEHAFRQLALCDPPTSDWFPSPDELHRCAETVRRSADILRDLPKPEHRDLYRETFSKMVTSLKWTMRRFARFWMPNGVWFWPPADYQLDAPMIKGILSQWRGWDNRTGRDFLFASAALLRHFENPPADVISQRWLEKVFRAAASVEEKARSILEELNADAARERKRAEGHRKIFASVAAGRKARSIELYHEVRPKHRKKTPAVDQVAKELGFSKGKVWEYLKGILP
jgi:hypothetical protein